MHPWEAKKLKVGDTVIWHGEADHNMTGIVKSRRYSAVWILWLNGEEKMYHVDAMRDVVTQSQLDAAEENKRAVEAVNQMNKDRLKTHYADGKPIASP